jgi:DNA repair exonuclease SbcCD ATPase subunit
MIYLKNLEAEGAFSFGPIDVPLAQQGLALITGSNLDDFEGSVGGGASASSANGAGKSALLDILAHNLFATTGRGVRKNGVVNTENSRGYYSKLTFSIGEEPYSYLQSRSHAEHGTSNVLMRGKKNLEIKGLDETQEEVSKIVGLTIDDWTATTYLSQGAKHLFVRSDGNDAKKKMLARIFSLDYKIQLEKSKAALEQTRTALIQLKSSISATKSQLQIQLKELPFATEEDYQNKLTELNGKLEDVRNKIRVLELELQAFHNAKVASSTKSNYATHLQETFVNLGIWQGALPTLADFEAFILTNQQSLDQVNGQYRDVSGYIEALTKRDAALVAFKPWEGTNELAAITTLSDLEARMAAAQAEAIRLQTLYSNGNCFTELVAYSRMEGFDADALKQRQKDLEATVQTAKDLAATAQTTASIEESNWKKVEAGTCYACQRPYPPELLAEAKAKNEAAQQALLDAKAEVVRIEKEVKDEIKANIAPDLEAWSSYGLLKARIHDRDRQFTAESYQVKVKELSEEVVTTKTFIASVKLCKAAYESAMAVSEIAGDTAQYQKYKGDLETSRNQFTTFLASLRTVQPTLKSYEDLVVPDVKAVDEVMAKATLNNLRADAEKFSSEQAVWERDLQLFNDYTAQLQKIMARESEIDILEKNEQVYNALSYAFGPKGLIVSRLSIICTYLTERVNYFISRILRENIHVTFMMDGDSLDLIININGKERGIGNLSGGEAAKVGLACMFGLRSLLPERYQTNILVLDEADTFLDERVRYELVDILQYLVDSTNLDSIFMITHSTSVQEMQVWNTRIHCTKERGISRIETIST